MSNLVLSYIASIIKENDLSVYSEYGSIGHLLEFDSEGERAYEVFSSHIREHGGLPSAGAFEKKFGQPLPPSADTPSYYYQEILNSHITSAIASAADVINPLLRGKKPLEALEVLSGVTDKLNFSSKRKDIVDFRDSGDSMWPNFEERWRGAAGFVKFGWPYFDEMSGGVGPGDLISLVGRPAQGKTFHLLHIALNVWNTIDTAPVLFFSMEMNPTRIISRLSAMQTKTPMDSVSHGEFASLIRDERGIFKAELLKLKDRENPFYVVDSNMATSSDEIIAICRHIKPSCVFIDGGYLVTAPGTRNIYEAVQHNTLMFKSRLAESLKVPVIVSWQFNRESKKVKETEQVGLEHIGHSDAIGQASSVVLGLFEEGSPETAIKKKVSILKGRDGEVGSFYVNWDFKNMDFSEAVDEDDEGSLKFI